MITSYRPYIKRFIIASLVALIFVGTINETAHLLQKDATDRPSKTLELVIPAGTAHRVNTGGGEPTIPEELTFVVGDSLVVKNLDEVPHELGPLFIPAGASASMRMEDSNKYTLGCTFSPSKYLDFDVRSRTTVNSRIQALSLATPPTAMFFFVYSLLIFPINLSKETDTNV